MSRRKSRKLYRDVVMDLLLENPESELVAVLSPSSVRTVFLALCGYAALDGTRVFPPRKRLEAEVGLEYRRVRDVVRELVDAGLVDRIGGGHRGRVTEFRINVEIVEFLARKGALHCPLSPERGHSTTGKGALRCPPKT